VEGTRTTIARAIPTKVFISMIPFEEAIRFGFDRDAEVLDRVQ
jgi:hypothetical protein